MFHKKNSHESTHSSIDKLSSIISTLEEIIDSEEKRYDEFSQMKHKLASFEKSKEEARRLMEKEKERVEQLYQFEKAKTDEMLREKENEVEEYKRKLKKEADIVLEAEINKFKKIYEEKNTLRSKVRQESTENKTKADFENKMLAYYNKMQEEMAVFKSIFAEHYPKEEASFELIKPLNNAESIRSIEDMSTDWNESSNDEDYGMVSRGVLGSKLESDVNIVSFDRTDEMQEGTPIDLLLKLQETRGRQLAEMVENFKME